MNAIPDHYAALGIDPTADPEVIAAAYRALAKKYHPDTGATTGTASPERFEQVQRAYEVLRTPESRRQYDLELLAQAERDLEEHLARKRRALPGAVGAAPGTANPDLGAIRPDPSAAGPQGRGPAALAQRGNRRSFAPFLIPAVLLLALLTAAAWLFLPRQFGASPTAVAESTAPAVETSAPPPPAATQADTAAAPKVDTAAKVEEPPQPATTKADAESAAASTPVPAAGNADAEDAQQPVFGRSEPEQAQEETETAAPPAPIPPAPTPKPRPAKQKTATAAEAAPRQRIESGSAYTLIIFERRRRGRVITQQADMLFASRGSCVEFGVKAVLRRMEARNMNPRRQRIWYECQPAS